MRAKRMRVRKKRCVVLSNVESIIVAFAVNLLVWRNLQKRAVVKKIRWFLAVIKSLGFIVRKPAKDIIKCAIAMKYNESINTKDSYIREAARHCLERTNSLKKFSKVIGTAA